MFKVAEIAQFSQAQLSMYEDSLKEYRDMFSVMETQREKGKKERDFEIAKNAIKAGIPIQTIVQITGLTKLEIEKL